MARQRSRRLRELAARVAEVIRVEAIWLATEPLDMRAGANTALARVIQVFGAATPHHAYCFANPRANRMKVLVHDGIGVWLAARRLNRGKFLWASSLQGAHVSLEPEQWQALVLGLPWQHVGRTISVL
jgi:transposase